MTLPPILELESVGGADRDIACEPKGRSNTNSDMAPKAQQLLLR
jgi:hypothetical protein